MTEARYQFIRQLNADLSDLPDGAFLGVMEELGVDVDELGKFSREFQRRNDNYADECQRRKDRNKARHKQS